MMKNSRLFVLILLSVLIIPSAHAALIGVNRATLSFDNVLRNGYSQEGIVVSSGSSGNVSIFYEARGDIADWIRFDPENQPLIINADSPGTINVIVEPPADARVDEYTGSVLISSGPLGEIKGNVGTNVEVAFEVKITVSVTDTQILSCSTAGVQILDTEVGREIPFIVSLSNNGNVRVNPEFKIEVYDRDLENLVSIMDYSPEEEFLPTTTNRLDVLLDNNIEPGQYWAYVSAPLCGSDRHFITFSVLEKGGISDVGELIRVENDPWAVVGETVPVNVYFRNRGERFLSAQFKGVVTKEGRIMKVITSEERDVAPGELAVFEMFYNAPEFGQYKVNGRVHYNNKVTYEKGSILNVNPSSGQVVKGGDFLITALLVFVILIIGFLIFKIIKKKKKFRY